ncbi:MAG: CPBP family intramembrane metalloprotease [Ignavibacteria bacterium]|nr:CPBP family intramembrane metalloprotease [Ignavibacteria bacterium]
MKNVNLKLYLIFAVMFLVMHFTGVIVAKLPYILNALITSTTVIGLLLLILKWDNKSSIVSISNNLGFKKTNLKSIAPGIILSLALLLAYPLLSILLNVKIFLAEDWIYNLIGLSLTAGIAEEMLFRGYLFGTLRREMNFRKAAILSSVLFTLAHLVMFIYMAWEIALMSTLLAISTSIPLAYLFERGNNTLWSPAIVHTVIRTIGLVVTTDEIYFMKFSLLWITVILVLPYIVLLFYKDFRTIWSKE